MTEYHPNQNTLPVEVPDQTLTAEEIKRLVETSELQTNTGYLNDLEQDPDNKLTSKAEDLLANLGVIDRDLLRAGRVRQARDGALEQAKALEAAKPTAVEASKPAATEVVEPAPAPENEFVRQGDMWKITFNGDTCFVPNLIGMSYILELMLRPNELVNVNALITQPSSILDIDWRVRKKIADEDTPGYTDDGDEEDGYAHLKRPRLKRHRSAGTDGKASPREADGNAFLKDRALELGEEIADRRRRGKDFAKQLAELEEIKACITSQSWHGKFKDPLSFATETEKARKSVSSAIKGAIAAIRKLSPAIADHFEKNIELGKEMMYRPHIVPNWKISRGTSC